MDHQRLVSILLLTLLLGCSGSFPPVTAPFQLVTESLQNYESSFKKNNSYRCDYRVVTTKEMNSQSTGAQHDDYLLKRNGLYFTQQHDMRLVLAGNEVLNKNYLSIQNPNYFARMESKDGQFILEEATEEILELDREPLFKGSAVSALLEASFIKAYKATEMNGAITIECVCDGDLDSNVHQYHTINADFGRFEDYWLPTSISASYFPGMSAVEDSAQYEWSHVGDLPKLREIVESTITTGGTVRKTVTTFETTPLDYGFDQAHCFLSHYGLVEPIFPSKAGKLTSLIVGISVIVLFVACTVLLRYKYFRKTNTINDR